MKVTPRVLGSLVIAGLVVAGTIGVGIVSDILERDGAFTIERFDQHVSISSDGETEVVEELMVDFSRPRRGIFRDLDSTTEFQSTGHFDQISVDQGDPEHPWNFIIEGGPWGPRIRIGDASTFLDPGRYPYRISYLAPSWYYRLADDPEVVEVRIDSPGYEWPTAIDAATLTVDMPGQILDVACVEGPRATISPCNDEPVVDGSRVHFSFSAFTDREGATVSVQVPAEAFAADLNIPTYDAVPLGARPGGFGIHGLTGAPWPVGRVGGAIVLLVLLAVPILVWEMLSTAKVYRDRVTDPALHDRQHPTALPAPPFGFRAPEIAGLRLIRADNQLFLANLVDLDQRGLVTTATHTVKGRLLTKDRTVLTVSRGPALPHAHPMDAEVVNALLPRGAEAVFDGRYDEKLASRVSRAQKILRSRANTVFDTHGFTHDEGGLLASTWFRLVMGAVYVLFAAAMIALVIFATPLHPLAAAAIALLVLGGWLVISLTWRHHRLPLNSEGRDATAQTRAFEEFIRTVEGDQIEWAAGQPGIDHHHPAISLLPYAIALGLADSWFDRFSSVMQELTARAPSSHGAGTAAAAWWASQSMFSNVRSSHSGTTTAPSSSGSSGGGGGGGSGGGGGGGGSW